MQPGTSHLPLDRAKRARHCPLEARRRRRPRCNGSTGARSNRRINSAGSLGGSAVSARPLGPARLARRRNRMVRRTATGWPSAPTTTRLMSAAPNSRRSACSGIGPTPTTSHRLRDLGLIRSTTGSCSGSTSTSAGSDLGSASVVVPGACAGGSTSGSGCLQPGRHLGASH